MHRTLYLGAICAALLVALPAVAFADEADVDPAPAAVGAEPQAEERDAPRRGLEEIVVRSRKRAVGEAAQDIPIASTVLSAATIEQNNYYDLIEMAKMVPGADFRQTATFPGIQRFWLRAVGVSFSVPNFDPAVGVYQDGVFVAQNIAAVLDTFDMESIEVLRGPQGTLFGRNTSVGAVVTRSRRPGDEFLARARVTVGSYSQKDFSLSVEGPLIEEKLLGKVALQTRDRDGWMDNLTGGSDYGRNEFNHFRATVVATPVDEFDLTLIYEYFERDGDGAVSAPLGLASDGTANHPNFPGGGKFRDFDETWGPGSAEEPWDSFSDHEISKLIAEANWDLGHGVVTSVTGHIDVKAFSGSHFDGLPPNMLSVITRLYIDQDQISQELRYASNFSDKYDFTVGLYYFQQDLTYGEQRSQNTLVTPANPFGFRDPGHDELDHKSWAVFAEGRIHLNDRLTLTLGGRYTDEEKDVKMGLVLSGSCSAATVPPFETSTLFSCTSGAMGGWDIVDDEDWTSFSPKVGLQYQYDDDVLLFTSWTRGFRSGGFSFRASPTELTTPGIRPSFYDEEQVDSLEIGMKSDFLENRLRLNVSAYYQWWEGIQRNLQEGGPTDAIQRTANVDDSNVYGLEVEFNAIVGEDVLTDGDMLRVDGSVGIAESEYDSDYFLAGQDLSGQEFGAPHDTGFLGVLYEHPMGGDGATLSWRASYWYMSDWWSEGLKRPTGINNYNDRNKFDVSIQYTSADGRWYAKLFGKNLSDDENYAARVPFANTFGLGNPEDPRTYGFTFGMEFGP
jgi:iron complex outermembrane receptor protein